MKKGLFPLLIFTALVLALSERALAFGPQDLTIPAGAETVVYGTTGAGRELTAYRFGAGKNVMVLGFAIHGFEDNWNRDGGALVYTAGVLMERLSEKEGLLEDYGWTVYILPCMNPDGLLDGYSMNGPGRWTTTHIDAGGELVSGGIDLNRSFPHNWRQMSGSRNYNGTAPLASLESRALAQLIGQVRGAGTNLLIDAHGWTSQIITAQWNNQIYQVFHERFPGNSYSSLQSGSGYFASYAADLGYNACLFEFPDGLYGMDAFVRSGYAGRYCDCVLELLRVFGTYDPRVEILVTAQGRGTVSGGGRYSRGGAAVLTATPGDHARFAGWYDERGVCLSTDSVYDYPVLEAATVTGRFVRTRFVTCIASRSGDASGGGEYDVGAPVTLTAEYDPETAEFQGWYSVWGNLVGAETAFTWTPASDATVYALYAGDVFADIPAGAWYLEDALKASALGLIGGTTNVTFSGGDPMTRAMAVTLLYRLAGEPDGTNAETPDFDDVAPEAWYAPAVRWAAGQGIAGGWHGRFLPEDPVTRQDFLLMLARYQETLPAPEAPEDEDALTEEASEPLEDALPEAEPALLPYADAGDVSDYALEAVTAMETLGLLRGDDDNRLRPADILTRAEGAALLVRYLETLDTENPLTEFTESGIL